MNSNSNSGVTITVFAVIISSVLIFSCTILSVTVLITLMVISILMYRYSIRKEATRSTIATTVSNPVVVEQEFTAVHNGVLNSHTETTTTTAATNITSPAVTQQEVTAVPNAAYGVVNTSTDALTTVYTCL